jgi:hypothetical protein
MQISERMWSLWPQIIQCFYEWAVDYFDHISGALENYICKGAEQFLAGNRLQQVPTLTCKLQGRFVLEFVFANMPCHVAR